MDIKPDNCLQYNSPEKGKFSIFFTFPPELQPKVLKAMQIEESKEDQDPYVEASYKFAHLIDPHYLPFDERHNGYKVNPETERLLTKFYEMINNHTREDLDEARNKFKALTS